MPIPAYFKIVVTALTAGVFGFFIGKRESGGGEPGKLTPGVERASGRADAGAMQGTNVGEIPSALVQLLGTDAFSDTNIQNTTFRVLLEGDPIRRNAAIGLILENMTTSNAASIRQAFIDSTRKTGRRHEGEWVLMVKKLGATLGAGSFDLIKDNPTESSLAMEGWAMADPAAAAAKMSQLSPDDPQYWSYWSALLNGTAQKDPESSFRLALSQPKGGFDAKTLFLAAVRTVGLDSATASLQTVLDESGPDITTNKAFGSLFDALSDYMFGKYWSEGTSDKILGWIEQQKDQPFITPEVIAHGARDAVQQGHLGATLDWLKRMNASDASARKANSALLSVLVKQPAVLSDATPETLAKLIGQLGGNKQSLDKLANAVETLNPTNAGYLRAAAGD